MGRKLIVVLLAMAAAAGAGFFFASKFSGDPQAHQAPVDVMRPVEKNGDIVLQKDKVNAASTGDPIFDSVKALIDTAPDKGNSAIPVGTKLISVNVSGGTATVELDEGFKKLQAAGSTGESLAQNALRAALAGFKEVERMTVIVQGKTYEGEHSGPWAEIPVRDEETKTADSGKK